MGAEAEELATAALLFSSARGRAPPPLLSSSAQLEAERRHARLYPPEPRAATAWPSIARASSTSPELRPLPDAIALPPAPSALPCAAGTSPLRFALSLRLILPLSFLSLARTEQRGRKPVNVRQSRG